MKTVGICLPLVCFPGIFFTSSSISLIKHIFTEFLFGKPGHRGCSEGGCQHQPQGSGELRDGGTLAQSPPSEMASPDRGAPGIIPPLEGPLTLSTGLAPRLRCRPESRNPLHPGQMLVVGGLGWGKRRY